MCQRSIVCKNFVVIAAALALSGAARAAPDAKVLAAATAAQPAVVDTLRALVLIETGSTDLGGLAKMAALLDDRLKALGFTTERRKVTSGALLSSNMAIKS